MEFPLHIISKSEKDTKLFVDKLYGLLKKGDIVVFNADLGAGKTFIVKKFIEKYKLFNGGSPTFAIVNVYENELITVNHFDFYRIEDYKELLDIGFNEYLNDQESITFIEWGNMYKELLPSQYYLITIFFDENLNRKITLEKINKEI